MLYKHIKPILMILTGAFLFSIAINYFAIPNKLAEGGFTGIALVLHYLFGYSPGTVILVMNIPLFFIGYKVFGKRALLYTILGTVSVSVAVWLTEGDYKPIGDPLLAALYTGVLIGGGLGLIFRAGGTTGVWISSPAWSISIGTGVSVEPCFSSTCSSSPAPLSSSAGKRRCTQWLPYL